MTTKLGCSTPLPIGTFAWNRWGHIMCISCDTAQPTHDLAVYYGGDLRIATHCGDNIFTLRSIKTVGGKITKKSIERWKTNGRPAGGGKKSPVKKVQKAKTGADLRLHVPVNKRTARVRRK